MTNKGNNIEMVSVSTLAQRLGVSEQTIRNRIRKGVYEAVTFQRGKMIGYLIRYNNGKNQ